MILDTNGPSLGFAEVDQSLRDMADWPRPARRRLAAERLIGTAGLSPRQIIGWFGRETPATPEGAMALAAALRAIGDDKAAADLILRTWRGMPFDVDVQRTMMARFGDVLTVEDHVRRADMLLFGAQGPAARDLIPLLPQDQQALAQARIAFRQRSASALALADALPPSVAAAPGLAFEKAAHYRRAGLDQLARAELVRFPREAWSQEMGARIWDERYQLTLSALRNRDSRAAYEAAANTGLQTGPDAVEAEFYAGWIALTRLKDPLRAETHFKHIDRVGTSPITLARGLYWRGRAVEALAGIDAADVFYRAAARHRTTFYGQLAAERAGFVRLDLGRDPRSDLRTAPVSRPGRPRGRRASSTTSAPGTSSGSLSWPWTTSLIPTPTRPCWSTSSGAMASRTCPCAWSEPPPSGASSCPREATHSARRLRSRTPLRSP